MAGKFLVHDGRHVPSSCGFRYGFPWKYQRVLLVLVGSHRCHHATLLAALGPDASLHPLQMAAISAWWVPRVLEGSSSLLTSSSVARLLKLRTLVCMARKKCSKALDVTYVYMRCAAGEQRGRCVCL